MTERNVRLQPRERFVDGGLVAVRGRCQDGLGDLFTNGDVVTCLERGYLLGKGPTGIERDMCIF